jgi:hypothetical protein
VAIPTPEVLLRTSRTGDPALKGPEDASSPHVLRLGRWQRRRGGSVLMGGSALVFLDRTQVFLLFWRYVDRRFRRSVNRLVDFT